LENLLRNGLTRQSAEIKCIAFFS